MLEIHPIIYSLAIYNKWRKLKCKREQWIENVDCGRNLKDYKYQYSGERQGFSLWNLASTLVSYDINI